ncbi:hypothetical protein RND81_07G191400 [Saponaria officinalis]|uniref:BHLH domain-containing protein n=1 Tax=Saponaria officinalis TaxID=3572 RepID=A0AAW1JQ96_SAPOF
MTHSRGFPRPPPLSPLRRLLQRRRRWRGRRGAVERKVRRLQRLIPGGQRVHYSSDKLYVLTVEYILKLRLQVNLLHTLSKIYSSHM